MVNMADDGPDDDDDDDADFDMNADEAQKQLAADEQLDEK